MRRYLPALFLILLSLRCAAQSNDSDMGGALSFKENKKQWDSRIIFETELHNGSVFLCRRNITFMVLDSADMQTFREMHHPHEYKENVSEIIHGHVFRENFVGANAASFISGTEKLTTYYNYYLGNDRSKWASHVNAYSHVVYSGLYKGIDLDVTSEGVSPKYSFIVNPGADATGIVLNYEGLDGINLINNTLELKTSVGIIADSKPYAYQLINGQTEQVNCVFKLDGSNVSFSFPDGYNKGYKLVIDPVLVFSTYSGATSDNFGYSATYDSKGNAYAAGTSFYLSGGSYPITPGAFQMSWAGGTGEPTEGDYGTDVAITKYDSLGRTRIYSTYLGGNHDELPHSLIVNSNDELYVLGTTGSSNFPVTPNAFDTSFNGGYDAGLFSGIGIHYSTGCDMFVTHFNSDGTALLGSTYLGGTGNDGITYPEYSGLNYNYADEVRGEITIDNNNNVYVASTTRSHDFPVTSGAYKTSFTDSSEGVVVKFNSGLTNIIWSTFLGGSDDDAIYSLDFDPNNDLYLAGGTLSNDFPVTAGALQQTNMGGRAEGFITHMSKNGNAILQSTFFGTPEYDQVYFVRTDKAGNAYGFGQTDDTTGRFIYHASYSKAHAGQFICKFKPQLDSLIWSTTFGSGRGQPDISPTAFSVDVCNKTYISGWGSNFNRDYHITGAPALSTAGLYVTPDAYQLHTDNQDFYVMVMSSDASAIDYATYFGSPSDEDHVDGGTSRFDRKGIIYQSACAGCACCGFNAQPQSNFPTTDSVVSRTNNSPNCNNAVFKLDLQLPLVIAAFTVPGTICISDTVTPVNSSRIVITPVYQWNFGDGSVSDSANPVHIYTQPGAYMVQLVVSDTGSCNFSDTVTKQIVVLGTNGIDTLSPINVCSGFGAQIGIAASTDTSVKYLWTPGIYLTQDSVADPFSTPPHTISYQLQVTNGICNGTFFQVVYVFNDSVTVTGANAACPTDTVQISVNSGQPGLQLIYNWLPVSGIVSGGNTAAPLVAPAVSTTFTVSVISPAGCAVTDSVRVIVNDSLPAISVSAVPDSIYPGDTSQLTLNTKNNVSYYQWTPDSTLSNPNILNPLATPRQTHAYYVFAQDAEGCKVRDTIVVYVLPYPCKSANVFVPDAFTPNGDGKNDVLYVRADGLQSIYFAVYDRWGQRMFETDDITRGWDGTYGGKKMDGAVFGYYLKATCATGENFEKKGNVTLLR